MPKIIFIFNRYVITALVMYAMFNICFRACSTNAIEWQVKHHSWVPPSHAGQQPPDGFHSGPHLLSTYICEYFAPISSSCLIINILFGFSCRRHISCQYFHGKIDANTFYSCNFYYNLSWWICIQLWVGLSLNLNLQGAVVKFCGRWASAHHTGLLTLYVHTYLNCRKLKSNAHRRSAT